MKPAALAFTLADLPVFSEYHKKRLIIENGAYWYVGGNHYTLANQGKILGWLDMEIRNWNDRSADVFRVTKASEGTIATLPAYLIPNDSRPGREQAARLLLMTCRLDGINLD